MRYERYDPVVQIASELVVPLLQDDRVIGVMSAVSLCAGRGPRRHRVRRGRRHPCLDRDPQRRPVRRGPGPGRQLAVLQAASSRMSRQNTIESVGRAIVEEIRQIIDYHNCRVYMLEDSAELLPIAFEGVVGAYEKVDFELLRTRLGEGFTGWVGDARPAAPDQRRQQRPARGDDPGYRRGRRVDAGRADALRRAGDRGDHLSKLGLNQFDEDNLRLCRSSPTRPPRPSSRPAC